MVGFKLVRKEADGLYSLEISGLARVPYYIGRISRSECLPLIQGPLAVFDTITNLKIFLGNHSQQLEKENSTSEIKGYGCEYEPYNGKQEMWCIVSLLKSEIEVLTTKLENCPKGTVLAESVKLLDEMDLHIGDKKWKR